MSLTCHLEMAKIIINMLKEITVIILITITHVSTLTAQNYFDNEASEQFYNIALGYRDANDLDNTLLFLNKADSAAPNTSIIIQERGALRARQKNYDEAIKDFTRAIELTTDPVLKGIAFNERGAVYDVMGKRDLACEDWNNAGKYGKSNLRRLCK